MAFKMKKGNIYRGLILRNEKANENYDTDFLYRQETEKRNLCFLRKFTVTINPKSQRSPRSSNIFAKLYVIGLFSYPVNIFAKILLL